MFQSLSIQDFSVVDNDNGKCLRVNTIGPTLLFIGSNSEPESVRVKKLVSTLDIQGLTLTYYNLDSNRNLIKMSNVTNTPIRNIPTIFFTVDGKIKAIYNKPININTMSIWFMEKMGKFTVAPQKINLAQGGTHDVEFKRPRNNPNNYSMNTQTGTGNVQDIPFIGANAPWRTDMQR